MVRMNELPPGRFREAAEAAAGRKPAAPIRARRGKMNKTETAFADEVLEHRRRVGEIAEWRFEPLKIMIGAGAWFTPDFVCRMPDGSITVFEIKGHRYAAGIVRLKTAAMLWPQWKFVLVMRAKGGRWSYTDVG